ncbi:MAG: hypothetical protein ACRDRK_16710 [Pseudonocardia sp.]
MGAAAVRAFVEISVVLGAAVIADQGGAAPFARYLVLVLLAPAVPYLAK